MYVVVVADVTVEASSESSGQRIDRLKNYAPNVLSFARWEEGAHGHQACEDAGSHPSHLG